MARARYVVIGEGAAGLAAAHELRRLAPQAAIGLFTDEPHPGYFRAALTNFLLGELREDQLWVNPPDFYEARSIRRAFSRVLAVDPARRLLWDSSSSEPVAFDGLLVASGARPRPPPFEGALLRGVVTLRTLHDARSLMDWLRLGRLERAVVLGGGPLGLEWAQALLERGVNVSLVERAPRLLPSSLDEVGSDLLALRLRQAGIEVILGDHVVTAYPDQSGGVAGVRLASGRDVPAALVAVALGVQPNSDFLRTSGLALAADGAVVVNRSLVTSAPGVWAAGDVARVDGELLALWEPARRQGRLAAHNMLGGSAIYEPGAFYFATRLFDLDFAKVGDIARGPGREEIIDLPRGTGTIAYRKLVLENGRLLGALMLGERAMRVRAFGRTLKRLVDARADLSSIKDKVWGARFDLDAWLETRKLLEKPPAPTATHAVAPAKLRGTQAVRLANTGTTALPSSVGTTALPKSRGTTVLPNGATNPPGPTGAMAGFSLGAASPSTGAMQMPSPPGTRQLSIGLPAVAPLAAVPAPAAPTTPSAWIERDGQPIRLVQKVTSLGVAPEVEIQLRAPRAGALHAQIVEHDGVHYVRDMGSHIGTYVNGDPLTGVRRLQSGDRIQIGGETLSFRTEGQTGRAATAEGSAAPRLMVRSGAHFGLRVRLGAHPVVIGQSSTSTLRLGDPGVAPEHAQVRFDGRGYVLEALSLAATTRVAGRAVGPGEAHALGEGAVIEVGSIELTYSEAPAEDAARTLAPVLRVTVDAGPSVGQSFMVRGRALVGSAPAAAIVIGGLAPLHFEIAEHQGTYFVRDVSGGQLFRKGRPLGPEFVAVEHGDLLLAGSGVLLRVEET